MANPRFVISKELDAALTAANRPQAGVLNSDAELVIASDPYDGLPVGIIDHQNLHVSAGENASFYTYGPVVKMRSAAALTAGTDVYLTIDSIGHADKWVAESGKRIYGIWVPSESELGASTDAADDDLIDVQLVVPLPRMLSGTATIALGDSTETVAVDAAFNGKTVVVGPSGGFDATATAFHGAVAAGTLTITANAAATADTDVAYFIAEAG